MFELLFDILKIFVVTNCRAYIAPVVLQILVFIHLRDTEHPLWAMFLRQPTLFNEEAGEISLSPLSSVLCTDTKRSSHAHVRECYLLAAVGQDVTSRLNAMTNVHAKAGWEGLRENAPEIPAMVEFLRTQIRALSSNQFSHYTGKPDTWLNARVGTLSLGRVPPTVWTPRNTARFLQTAFVFLETKVVGSNWSSTFSINAPAEPEPDDAALLAQMALAASLDTEDAWEPVDLAGSVDDVDLKGMVAVGDFVDLGPELDGKHVHPRSGARHDHVQTPGLGLRASGDVKTRSSRKPSSSRAVQAAVAPASVASANVVPPAPSFPPPPPPADKKVESIPVASASRPLAQPVIPKRPRRRSSPALGDFSPAVSRFNIVGIDVDVHARLPSSNISKRGRKRGRR